MVWSIQKILLESNSYSSGCRLCQTVHLCGFLQ